MWVLGFAHYNIYNTNNDEEVFNLRVLGRGPRRANRLLTLFYVILSYLMRFITILFKKFKGTPLFYMICYDFTPFRTFHHFIRFTMILFKKYKDKSPYIIPLPLLFLTPIKKKKKILYYIYIKIRKEITKKKGVTKWDMKLVLNSQL